MPFGRTASKRAARLTHPFQIRNDRQNRQTALTDTSATNLAGQSYALSGISTRFDPAHTPVRGDLAHVLLAGKVFVPHYSVPMPHSTIQATAVHTRPATESPPVGALPEGGAFDVLDMAGEWAWGVIAGEGGGDALAFGPVGYVPLSLLKPAP